MPDLAEVTKSLSRLDGFETLISRGEVAALPSILLPDEQITGALQGTFNDRPGLLVATDRRVIFVDKTIFGRLKVEEFPLASITSIQYQVGWVFGSVTIVCAGNKEAIRMARKSGVQPFADTVRKHLTATGKAQVDRRVAEAPSPPPTTDIIAQLERLGALHAAGQLSDAEFAAAKARIIG